MPVRFWEHMAVSNYKAVIFDMDGVIFDTERMVVKCWKVIADKYNIPNIEDHCREATGLNVAATKVVFERRYGTDLPYEDLRSERKEIFMKAFNNGEVDIKPGVVELLKFLKENGIKTAIASSTSSATVTYELKLMGLYDYFDEVVCGDMVSKSKPDPEIFLLAAEKLGVKPCEAFGIEDSYNGVRALRAANLHTIMVPDMIEPDDEMRKLSDIILPSLIETKEYIKERL